MAYRNTNLFYKNKIPKGFDLLDDSFVLDVANFMQVENKDEIKKLHKKISETKVRSDEAKVLSMVF